MIRFESVSKTHRSLLRRREVPAVTAFSLEIGTGEVFGIAGPNGAGKSTLMNLRVPEGRRNERKESGIAARGLAEHRRKKVRQLSKGNLQRLGLAQALISASDLVILDEPTHGFDPIWMQRRG